MAHDLHPEYASTLYARERPEAVKIGVQHHHAHVASAMAEHRLEGPVLGVAYDGTGFGTDGTSWGGELLLCEQDGFERLATFRPIPLAGGDVAMRQVWRIALALLDDAFNGRPPIGVFPVFAALPQKRVELVREMTRRRIQSPLARGVGRYFDALGSLFLSRPDSRYEGQVALEWNMTADPREDGAYRFALDAEDGLPTVDLRPMVRDATADFRAGESPGRIAARFHRTLAHATGSLVRTAAGRLGPLPVVLTGGCFQNALLAELVVADLGTDFRVYLHGDVPPGDGGLALGQALVAAAVARRSEGDV